MVKKRDVFFFFNIYDLIGGDIKKKWNLFKMDVCVKYFYLFFCYISSF